jgi:hypothetical protein
MQLKKEKKTFMGTKLGENKVIIYLQSSRKVVIL